MKLSVYHVVVEYEGQGAVETYHSSEKRTAHAAKMVVEHFMVDVGD